MNLRPSSSTLMWYGIPIAIFLIAIAYVFLTTRVDLSNPKITTSLSAPLVPNTQLQLAAGEKYAYAYSFFGEPATAAYEVISIQPPCAYVSGEFTSNATGARIQACIYIVNASVRSMRVLDGQGQQQQQLNASLDFVQPFMLALRENWRWQQNTTIVFDQRLEVAESDITAYETGQLATYRGRRAFKTTITTTRIIRGSVLSSASQTVYVDAEKRVLLLADSPQIKIELVSGPFNLTN